jgi:hypothetical protein
MGQFEDRNEIDEISLNAWPTKAWTMVYYSTDKTGLIVEA